MQHETLAAWNHFDQTDICVNWYNNSKISCSIVTIFTRFTGFQGFVFLTVNVGDDKQTLENTSRDKIRPLWNSVEQMGWKMYRNTIKCIDIWYI